MALSLSFASCGYRGNKSGIHWFLDMHDNLAVEAQEEDYSTLEMAPYTGTPQIGGGVAAGWNGPGSTMRVPPEGTVVRGTMPYEYEQGNVKAAGAELKNPLPRTHAILARGKKQFEIYCAICHGKTGHGDGNVTPMLSPPPPSLISGPAASTWTDGNYFHMITMGRARMKSYAAQIQPADRWAIVHYVRMLQANPTK